MQQTTPSAIDYADPHTGRVRAAKFDRPIAPLWLWVAAMAGIFCRLMQYFAQRSWWVDEASLVLNIRSRGPAALMGHLDYAQAAPPMFLLAERALWTVFGQSELSLRALPVAAGVVSVILFAVLVRRALPSPWSVIAMTLFSLSDRLIYHDTELKPYGIDVMFAVLLLLISLDSAGSRSHVRRALWAGVVAAVGVWFSFPAILVLGAVSLALLPGIWRGKPMGWLIYIGVNLLALASLAAVLYLTRQNRGDSTLVDYWKDSFFDWKHPWTIPVLIARRLNGACDYAFPAAGPVVLIATALGAYVLLKAQKYEMLMLLGGPVLMVMLAAAVHRYPFDGARLNVFLTPGLLILAVFGFRWLVLEFIGRFKWVSLVPLGFVMGTVLYWAAFHLIQPRNRSHIGPVAGYIAERVRPDDMIYTFDLRPFECYWPANDSRVVEHLDRADEMTAPSFWLVWPSSSDRLRGPVAQTIGWLKQFCRQDDAFANDADAAIHFQRIAGRAPAQPEPPYRGPGYEPRTSQK